MTATSNKPFDLATASQQLADRLRASMATPRPSSPEPPLALAEVYATNRCPLTAEQWRAMHRRTGYTLGNVPPADLDVAALHQCAPEANAFAQSLLDGESPAGLVITGEPGRGKTHAACAVMRCVIGEVSVGLATDAELVRDAKAAFGGRSTEAAVVDRFCAPQLLVLDDFGKAAYSSEWALQLAFEVIDRRIKQRKATVVTTQYTAPQLMGKLTVNGDDATGKAIVSRLRTFRKLHLDGGDRRRRA